MNRRNFVKSLTSAVSLSVAAPQLLLPDQHERRIWQLDRTMTTPMVRAAAMWDDLDIMDDSIQRWMDAMEPSRTPFLDRLPEMKLFSGPMVWGSK